MSRRSSSADSEVPRRAPPVGRQRVRERGSSDARSAETPGRALRRPRRRAAYRAEPYQGIRCHEVADRLGPSPSRATVRGQAVLRPSEI